jgi:hypothetical protein
MIMFQSEATPVRPEFHPNADNGWTAQAIECPAFANVIL